MTAKELIEALRTIPQDAQINISYNGLPCFRGIARETTPAADVCTNGKKVILKAS